jgi:hypothetical protein
MKLFFTWLMVLALLVAGCDNGLQTSNPFKGDPSSPAGASASTDTPARTPPQTTKPQRDFTGHSLTVTLDGQVTRPGRTRQGQQIWDGGVINPTPILTFTLDEQKLGAFQRANLIINPRRDGRVDPTDLWEYAGSQPLQPAVNITLDRFNHFADNTMQQDLTALPPGTYRISLQVTGENTWDRQYIDVTVE